MRVHVPPRIEKKESGIRRREAFKSVLRASARTTGTNTTTTGMWLTNAESGNVRSARAARARHSLVPAIRMKMRARVSIAPVRSSPALKTNMQLITIGALLLKTVSVSSALRTPVTSSTPIALSATRSGDSHSRRKAVKTATTSAKTMMR